MVGTHPAATGWVPDAAVLEEPTAEGIHKDGDGPDQASDSVDDLAHLPGRSPVLADLGVTALGLGHGPHLLPGSSPPRQGQRVIRGEVPEKARRAYGMGRGGVDTIPTQRRGSSAWARMVSGGRPRRRATSATERQWTVASGGGGRDGPSHGTDQRVAPTGPGDYGEPEVDPGRGPGHGDGAGSHEKSNPVAGSASRWHEVVYRLAASRAGGRGAPGGGAIRG